ncbi:MAG: hypothetical protein PHQ40_10025 [Anaerolineaceae bacterium]|nr:hypothetical protein [Anaerolineaceae bacterium]
MSIDLFELFHGVVLTKLLRSGHPVKLCMVETNPKECWSAYKLNDEVMLYIKFSTNPQVRKKDALVWIFTFSPANLIEIQRLRQDQKVYFALVCGDKNIHKDSMHVCFLEAGDFDGCIDLGEDGSRSISVKYFPGKKLRVWGNQNGADHPLNITARALEKWTIPGG